MVISWYLQRSEVSSQHGLYTHLCEEHGFARYVMQATNKRSSIMKTLTKLFKDESGATAIEYGLIAALISIAAIAAMTLIGDELDNTFNSVQTALQTNSTDTGG